MSLNFAKYTNDLCSLVKKSKIFKLQLTPGFVYQKSFEPNSRTHSQLSNTTDFRTVQPIKYKNPRRIENILELVDDRNSSNSDFVPVGYNDNLNAAVCNVFDKISVYISDGIEIDEIPFQFLIGKSVHLSEPAPLALVGQPKLKFVEKSVGLEKLYPKLKYDEGKLNIRNNFLTY